MEREFEVFTFSCVKTENVINLMVIYFHFSVLGFQHATVPQSTEKNVKSCHFLSRTSKERYSISKT